MNVPLRACPATCPNGEVSACTTRSAQSGPDRFDPAYPDPARRVQPLTRVTADSPQTTAYRQESIVRTRGPTAHKGMDRAAHAPGREGLQDMPVWLGCTLAGIFAAVALYRLGRRELPAMLMALGMAVMAVDMSGIGPHLVHGPWWAAGFAVLAVWSASALIRAPRPWTGQLLHGHLPHLVGGAAMIYMCVAGLTYAAPVSVTPVGFELDGFAAGAGHHHGGAAALSVAGLGSGPGAVGPTLFAMAGWLLAVYFLFASVCVLTSRRRGVTDSRRHAVAEAAMGVGTMIMLVSMI